MHTGDQPAQDLIEGPEQLAALFVALFAEFAQAENDLLAAAADQANRQAVQSLLAGGEFVVAVPLTLPRPIDG